MSFFELLRHFAGFLAPALVVAVIVALAARLVQPPKARPHSWWTSVVLNTLAGIGVLAAGLWFFGRDGKMATYTALVIVVATVQWLGGRGWRS